MRTMNALVLINSFSSMVREGLELVLPYLEHFGIPLTLVDLSRDPLPDNTAEYPLIILTHRKLDEESLRLGKKGRGLLRDAVRGGSGLVSFDPLIPTPDWWAETGVRLNPHLAVQKNAIFDSIEINVDHYITSLHESGEVVKLASPLRPALLGRLGGGAADCLLSVGGKSLLTITPFGEGRVVCWSTSAWMHSCILGPLAGLDDILWRSLVWAARKPFAMRGFPPIVTMRVDDVAGCGELWNQTPLYWARVANEVGFKPWMGLFIYNLKESTVDELRGLIKTGQATAFPHAFGRPNRSGKEPWYYNPDALPLRAAEYDEFIYFNHQEECAWSDAEAARGLKAVDDWYAAHAPLPISRCAIAHWSEIAENTLVHVRECWGADLSMNYNDIQMPLNYKIPWLKAGPFRRFEKPGSSMPDTRNRGNRPVYYADTVNFAGYPFFIACTEIRDDAGYEWKPDNDVAASIGRGVRQLKRALDSFALPVLFTHETDYIYKISPENWQQIIHGVALGIADYNPQFVTLDEGVRMLRATKTAHFENAAENLSAAQPNQVTGHFTGSADMRTQAYLFTEERGKITSKLVDIPEFEGEISIEWTF